MNSSLGIYFGPKAISLVEVKGRKLINNIQISHSAASSGELEEKVPAEAKVIGIIALFKEELRRNRVEAKEATLCLSGKDLIIRTFEMPVLPREELQSAINFEVKKYMPFKTEELISDFQLKFDKISRTNIVLFMGIKKEALDSYLSILSQLDIKLNAIEYSAFSILRCLKLSGASESGIIGILAADLPGKDEVNFTILENGFPLFSRDITLPASPEYMGKDAEAESSATLEKLKTEIRMSLDYYDRKFSNKNIKKMYLLFNQEHHLELEAFMAEIGFPATFIDINKCLDRTTPYSLGFVKSYSASLSKVIKNKLTVDLLAAQAKIKSLKEKSIQKEILSLFEGIKLDYRMAAAALFIIIASIGLGFYRTQPLRKELETILAVRPRVSVISPGASYGELAGKDTEYKRKLDALGSLVNKQVYITEPLDVLPRVLPKGVWLTSLSLNKRSEGKAELTLEGTAYLSDSDKEFAAVNEFLLSLKSTPAFTKYFKDINVTSLNSGRSQEVMVTNFLISCKTYQGRE
ncbi:MAG: PilN domain-containing protein [Candidatus Omnitrophota bacterium]